MNKIGQKLSKLLSKNLKSWQDGITEFRTCWKTVNPLKLHSGGGIIMNLSHRRSKVSYFTIWAPPSEFVSSSIPSLQILTAHAQPFRGARDLAFCLKVPLDSLLVWASSEGSGQTARMRRLAWTFAARIGDKYQIRLARPILVEPHHAKTCLRGFCKIQTSLLSYRS